MNAITKPESDALKPVPAGLALLRAPVPEHLISPLPKGTKAQNECPNDQKINCTVCGGWHHPKVRHLDFVGHAAATHLLLEADLLWDWEPLAYTEQGLPLFDESGGLWIKLTVCGKTRLGYGHADKKAHMDAGSREKEVIGDALRNAAMRFGLALELWSKADIHDRADSERQKWFDGWCARIRSAATVGDLKAITAAAIEDATKRKDRDAADDFLIEQADKMARAKRPAESSKQSALTGGARSNPSDDHGLTDDDIPH